MDKISKLFIWTFFLLWTLQCVLSRFGIYDMDVPRDSTLSMVALHMLFFYIGFKRLKINNKNRSTYESFFKLRAGVVILSKNPVYIALFLLAFAYIVIIFLQYWTAIMMAQSISDARADNALQELYGRTYYYMSMLFLYPINTLTMFLFAYKTFEKRDWLWVLMGLNLIIEHSLKGGRSGYVDIFVYVLFVGVCLLNYQGMQRNFFKRYSRFLAIGAIGLLMYGIIGLVTAGREGDVSMNSEAFNNSQETTKMHFVTYYIGPVVAFDQAVNSHIVERQGGYHFGALTFNFIEETIFMIVSRVGITYNRPIAQYAEEIQENYINIGAMNWNALYTWCNYFYCDLGILGLIIFPMIIGYLIRWVILYFYRKPNVYSASLLMIGYMMVVFSVIRYNLGTFSSFLLLCILFFMSEKESKKGRPMVIVAKK